MYHTFFYGPFKNEDDLVSALKTLDSADEMWSYNGFAIHRGDPTSEDWVTGLPFVEPEERERIEQRRRA